MSNLLQKKNEQRQRRRGRVRRKVSGCSERLRLTVYRSNKYLYLQAIDDVAGKTMAAASTLEAELKPCKPNVIGAEMLGKIMGERLQQKGFKTVVFDRNGYHYHGVVKAIADSIRSQGIEF